MAMNFALLNKYRKRFEEIEKVEEIENKKLSVQQKFQQLSSLFSLAVGLGLNFREVEGKPWLKSNWLLLKT